MTEQEAKELIKYINEEYLYYDKEGEFDEINEALDMAISALEEIQQYRALGTVKELNYKISHYTMYKRLTEKYREIGSPEELREARNFLKSAEENPQNGLKN